MSAPHLAALIVVLSALALLWTGALISALETASTPARRALWVVVIVLQPLLGPCLWFVGGRRVERATPA